MKNVLITSAGRRVSLVKAFQHELSILKPDAQVFTGDAQSNLSAACQVSSKSFQLPMLDVPGYVDFLEDLCKKEKIGLVIPTIDTELKLLAENRERFGVQGIHLVISDVEFINKCRDKRLTHKLFNSLNIDTPRLIDKNNPSFPLFAKPYDGSNSSELFLINEKSKLTEYHLENEKFLFFEYLNHNDHTEFTVDLYYDKNSNLKCIVPRERIEVRGGEVNKGITRKNDILEYLRKRIGRLEGARGCITLQLFQHNHTKKLYGIEINPRFGGGFPLSYKAGANYPKWIIQEYLLNTDIPEFDDWEENLLMLRYDDEVLVHDFKVE